MARWALEPYADPRMGARPPHDGAKTRRLFAPIGRVEALARFLRDPNGSLAGKLFLGFSVFYVALPFDVIPDAIPVRGWLDDLGVGGAAVAYALSVIDRYRDDSMLTG